MDEQYNRAFKGVWISKEIWLAKDLGWSEKLLLVEIDSLDGEQGCFASNEYLANFFGLSKNRISKMVSALKEKGYINVQIYYKEGTRQIEKRIIRVNRQRHPIGENANTYSYKCQEGIGENANTPIGENAKDNNTVINNTFNNTKETDKDIDTDIYKDIDKEGRSSVMVHPYFDSIKQAFEQVIRIATIQDCNYINEALDYYEPSLILKALEAGKNSARSFKYILSILDNWRKELGVTTYQDWIQKIQLKGGTSNGQPNGSNLNRTPEEMDMLAKLRNYSSIPRTR